MYITLESFINGNNERKLTLYHGTCLENAKNLIKSGWSPRRGCSGSNCGDARYLYLSSNPEDALWFAEEKGCNSVVEIMNIPIRYLKPDRLCKHIKTYTFNTSCFDESLLKFS